jgi:hypothetical protein
MRKSRRKRSKSTDDVDLADEDLDIDEDGDSPDNDVDLGGDDDLGVDRWETTTKFKMTGGATKNLRSLNYPSCQAGRPLSRGASRRFGIQVWLRLPGHAG